MAIHSFLVQIEVDDMDYHQDKFNVQDVAVAAMDAACTATRAAKREPTDAKVQYLGEK